MPLGARGKDKLVYKISRVEHRYCVCKSKITMATKQAGMSKKCEQQAVVKFLNAEGVCGNEIHKCIHNVNGEGAVMSR